MICEKTKQALAKLFPEPEPEVVEEVAPEAEEEEDPKKKVKKAEPRKDGVVERDYAVHGYHIDAQVAPNQLVEAVTILDDHEFFIETITGVDWIKENQLEVI